MPTCPMKPRPIGVIGHAIETEAKADTLQEEIALRARLPQSIADTLEEEITLNEISAPRHCEKKSWANGLTNGAQLVSVRVLRNTCQRHVTLNSKDQSLWPCVARRITIDLETGEVLADEDVTQMTKEELHRT